MASQLKEALAILAAEKKIDELYLLEKLEESFAKSYKSILNLELEPRVTIDRTSGKVYVFEQIGVGEPDEDGNYEEYEERDITPDNASRIVAQNVKKYLGDILRDHERHALYEEFSERIGELISGQVLQATQDFTIIKIRDGVEAELPSYDPAKNPGERNEKPGNERYRHNQRIKALIVDVRDPSDVENLQKGHNTRPLIVVSRKDAEFIRRLFEMVVPEIYEGVVEIKKIAREPGARSKVAVWSRESNLDPVGACVGPKGSRVRMVVEELHNERVDVIAWNENPAVFVTNALSPAKVTSVSIDESRHYATVVVPDDQLSLAIGKDGQNARLAARLTGWHIDIKSVSFVRAMSGEDALIDEDREEEPAFDGRCTYILADGKRCRNHAREGSRFCGIHDK